MVNIFFLNGVFTRIRNGLTKLLNIVAELSLVLKPRCVAHNYDFRL